MEREPNTLLTNVNGFTCIYIMFCSLNQQLGYNYLDDLIIFYADLKAFFVGKNPNTHFVRPNATQVILPTASFHVKLPSSTNEIMRTLNFNAAVGSSTLRTTLLLILWLLRRLVASRLSSTLILCSTTFSALFFFLFLLYRQTRSGRVFVLSHCN